MFVSTPYLFVAVLLVVLLLWVIRNQLILIGELRERPTYTPRYVVTDIPEKGPPASKGWAYVLTLIIFLILGYAAYYYVQRLPPVDPGTIHRAGVGERAAGARERVLPPEFERSIFEQ